MTKDTSWSSVLDDPRRAVARAGPWVATIALWMWAGGDTPWPLALAAVGIAGAVSVPIRRGRAGALGLALLTVAIDDGLSALQH